MKRSILLYMSEEMIGLVRKKFPAWRISQDNRDGWHAVRVAPSVEYLNEHGGTMPTQLHTTALDQLAALLEVWERAAARGAPRRDPGDGQRPATDPLS